MQGVADAGGLKVRRAFGVYVHVPFCAARCGYCDFTTYTASQLGGGASQAAYPGLAAREIELSRRTLADWGLPDRPADTVYFGGGTPTQLPARELVGLLSQIERVYGLAPGVEVTSEANPDSLTEADVKVLAEGGFTRLSLGMQSSSPAVLATLGRTHDPAQVPRVVAWAHQAGLAVSLDLIYGTPGESLTEWEASLAAALACDIGHLSIYALTIEPGTPMGRRVRLGQLPATDEDDLVAKYDLADSYLTAAGFGWYEISNFARGYRVGAEAPVCRHNLGYWRRQDWWGIGPGAHSGLAIPAGRAASANWPTGDGPGGRGGSSSAGAPEPERTVRWWNVKHPRDHAARLAAGLLPEAGRDELDESARQLEEIMLGIRLAEGLELARLSPAGRLAVAGLIADGLLDAQAALGSSARAVLTGRGRMLADAVTRTLAV